MNLSIKSKLRALSAFALIAPIMGFVAINQVDQQLRQLQAKQAAQTTQTLASVGALAPILQSLGASLQRLYTADTASLPLIDGYHDDWPTQPTDDQNIIAAQNGNQLFLLIRRAALPASGTTLVINDNLQLQLTLANDMAITLTSEHGMLQRLSRAQSSTTWVELSLDRSFVGNAISLMLDGRPQTLWLVRPSVHWQQLLDNMAAAQPSVQLAVADNAGLVLAASKAPPPAMGYASLLERAYTAMAATVAPLNLNLALGAQLPAPLNSPTSQGQFYLIDNNVHLVATAPIEQHNRVRGTLILVDQQIDATQIAGSTLLVWIIIALVASLLALLPILAFANWLQRRIRSLGQAVKQSDDSLKPVAQLGKHNDEIGQLAQAFEQQTTELFAKNRYLAQLASILGHEIRTPIVVVQSSLEHIERTQTSEQANYIERAKSGISRLDSSIRSMVSANHLEQSLNNYELETTDINRFANALIDNYQSIYGVDQVAAQLDIEHNLTAKVAPELIVQALDKLFDNAMRFSTDGRVQLAIDSGADELTFSLTNQGPLLQQSSDALTSFGVSESNHENSRHLGLGLYVADLIARYHGGQFVLRNLADGSGVVAMLVLANK